MTTIIEPKKTQAVLSRFELAKIISERTFEISRGSGATVRNQGSNNPAELAWREFREGRSPKKIIRVLEDGTIEIWNLTEFKYIEGEP